MHWLQKRLSVILSEAKDLHSFVFKDTLQILRFAQDDIPGHFFHSVFSLSSHLPQLAPPLARQDSQVTGPLTH